MRRENGLEALCRHERPSHSRVVRRTGGAHEEVLSHCLLIDTRQGVVYERNVVLSKGAAIHTERRGLGDLRYPRTLVRFRM